MLCFQGIQTARLPIGAYMKLASSQVLTVNHVVEILLSWLELHDWQQAFYKVIPTRKRAEEATNDTAAAAKQDTAAPQDTAAQDTAASAAHDTAAARVMPVAQHDELNIAQDTQELVNEKFVPQKLDAQQPACDTDEAANGTLEKPADTAASTVGQAVGELIAVADADAAEPTSKRLKLQTL